MSEGKGFFEAAGYEVQSLLGKGSDARVWLVRDKQFGHLRALKVLNDTVGEDLDSSDSFFKECALLLRICNGGHPNIVRIGRPRIVENKAMVEMQYIQGRTLTEYIHTDMHFVPYEEVLKFVHDIGSALAYCHVEGYRWMMAPGEDKRMTQEELIAHYGVAHNDLHSSNVMRSNVNNSYILLDFGLAIQDGIAVKSSMRNEGHPEYRAPEKFEAKMGGKQGDIRVDVYAFGVLLYEMLAGTTPFHSNPGDLETGRIYRLHKEMPIPEIEPKRREAFLSVSQGDTFVKDYPGWLENMVRKCLAKNPDARYANMKEFMDDFERNIALEKTMSAKRMDVLNKEKGELAKENSELQASIKMLEKQIEMLRKAGESVKATPTGKRVEIPAKVTPVPKRTPVWQGVLMGVLPIAAIGGVEAANHDGGYRAGVIETDESMVENVEEYAFLDTASLGPIPVASTVSGASSFSQAFSSARHEVGPGGVFQWKGNLYSTYTADEWGRLSSEQQSEFGVRIREVEFSPAIDEISSEEEVPREFIYDDDSSIDREEPTLVAEVDESNNDGEVGSEINQEDESVIQVNSEDLFDVIADEVSQSEVVLLEDNSGVEIEHGFEGESFDDVSAAGDC